MSDNFDKFLSQRFSPVGRFQVLFFITVSIATYSPIVFFTQFGYLVPHHHCKQPYLESLSWSREDILNLSIPVKSNHTKQSSTEQHFQPCEEYNLDSLLKDIDANTTLLEALELRSGLSNLTTRSCTRGISYNQETAQVNKAFGEEFNIVCERQFFIPASNTAYVIGMFIGFITSGPLCDRFGRWKIAIIFPFITGITGVSTSLVQDIWTWIALRVVTAITATISMVCATILISEWTTETQRNFFIAIQFIIGDFFSRSFMVFCFFIMPSWRYAYASVFVVVLPVFAGLYLWQESPRWLLSKGKTDEARKLIEKAMSINGRSITCDEKELTRNQLEELSTQLRARSGGPYQSVKRSDEDGQAEIQKNSFLGDIGFLLRNSTFRCRLLLLFVVWPVVALVAYGLNFNSVRLGNNPLLIAFITVLSMLPATVIQYLSFRFFDRKWPIVVLFALSSLSLAICFILILTGYKGTPVVTVSTTGLLFSSPLFGMIYVRTPEIFPTSVRASALGLCSSFARIGMITATFAERLDELVWPPLPMLIFTIASVLGTLASAFLPPGKGEMYEWQQAADFQTESDVHIELKNV